MARRSRMSILKRQRELKKSERAARKRAKRHGIAEPLFHEPSPTLVSGGVFGSEESLEGGDEDQEQEETETEQDGQQEA